MWCIASIIGIWPRFIEPMTLCTTAISLPISGLPEELEGFKILHLSDLHIHPDTPEILLKNIVKKTLELNPDLIVCTGDFLCYSEMRDLPRTLRLLQSLKAPYGSYAVLGNHDYAEPVSVNAQGDYDIQPKSPSSIGKGFKRLFATIQVTGHITERAKAVGHNRDLGNALKQTPFELLDNRTQVIPIGNSGINVVGLSEYTVDQCRPERAFKGYDARFPGIVLAHNPDSAPRLEKYPGDLILSGHTHGGQINLPWFWKKLTLLENPQYKKGLHRLGQKWLYVNRGIGSIMQFRWFAPPELTLITLRKGP